MTIRPAVCIVYRDRELQWLLGPKLVEQFTITLDMNDPRSLDRALLGAARRDRGDEADLDLYRLEVHRPDGAVLRDWRYNSWSDETAGAWFAGPPGG